MNSGTAYPFVISRNAVRKNALNFQNYVYLTSVNPIFGLTNRCRNLHKNTFILWKALSIEFQHPCKENISETPILFSLRFSTYPVWFHSRNFANSSLVRTRELLAKLATGRIIPRQTGLEENFHDLGIIATNYNVRVV